MPFYYLDYILWCTKVSEFDVTLSLFFYLSIFAFIACDLSLLFILKIYCGKFYLPSECCFKLETSEWSLWVFLVKSPVTHLLKNNNDNNNNWRYKINFTFFFFFFTRLTSLFLFLFLSFPVGPMPKVGLEPTTLRSSCIAYWLGQPGVPNLTFLNEGL